ERICLKHIEQINKDLNIHGYNEISAWRYKPQTGAGAQIDLVIDRKDFVINICEIKFSTNEFSIDKAYAASLRNKIKLFAEQATGKKIFHLVIITTFCVTKNPYEKELVEKSVTMDALFES
ncbi:MAG: ATPase, partial [Chitinophagaceae bacterium]|nr:ATPase [Chitinophagaceae bacterium]